LPPHGARLREEAGSRTWDLLPGGAPNRGGVRGEAGPDVHVHVSMTSTYTYLGGDPMRQHRETMHGAEPRGRGRRLMRRTCLSAAVLGLLGIGAVQAPAALAAFPVLESATPNKGCPGEAVVLTGKNFGSPGSGVAGFHGNALGSVPMQFNAKA